MLLQQERDIDSKEINGETIHLVEKTLKSGAKLYEVTGSREGYAGANLYGEFLTDKDAARDYFESF